MSRNRDSEQFHTNAALIWHFLSGSKRFFAVSILSACLVSLTDLINPKIIEYAVDSVIGDAPLSAPAFVQEMVERLGGIPFLKQHLLLIAGLVLLIALAGALFRYLFGLFNGMGAERFVQRTRDSLFGHILRLPFAWFSENSTGDILQRCTSDVNTIKVFVSEQLTSLFRVVLLIVMSMYFMAGINGPMAIAEGFFIPVVVLTSIAFYSKIGSGFERADEEEGRLSAIAQENLTGVRVVRAFGREIFEKERFEKQNTYYTGLWIHLMRILAAFWVSGNIVSTVRSLTILLLGVRFCVDGSLTAGELIAFISYNALISWPIRRLGRIITDMSKAGISVSRLRYIMNSVPEQESPEAGEPPMDRDIAFEHVTFAYPGSRRILDDVSFTVPAGSTVGILGPTGSGKTTAAQLLDRLYELDGTAGGEVSGRITVGGVDIRQIRRRHLRRNIGFVLQEPYLFSRTLGDNIAIGSENASMEDVRQAAALASLDETIQSFPKGYDTPVGERGVTLSGGQKQRTAIAQMLVRRPAIMIFDDSLSAVDAETDQRIRAALKDSIGNATTILIAHRITTLMQADQILVLDRGRIVQQGSHEELFACEGGLYKRIYELQTTGADL